MDAYLTAVRMLARRELSTLQVRQRLARRGFPDDEIDLAIARLTEGRALSDGRTALALARNELLLKHRGRLRAQRSLEAAGIPREAAQRALDEVCADIDEGDQLTTALRRRLRDDEPIADQGHLRRLYRFLIGQGFASDRVLAHLRARRRSSPRGD